MQLLEPWTVTMLRFKANRSELQNVHLNEIAQFDFAEVIRKVILVYVFSLTHRRRYLQPGNYFRIRSCEI